MHKPKLWLLMLLTPLFLWGTADVSVDRLRMADGLMNSNITSLVQDHHGFVWIATPSGLQRFDGHSFRTYRAGEAKTGLMDGYVSQLYVDDSTNLWVGSSQYLSRYDDATDSFTHYEILPDDDTHWIVNGIQMDSRGRLWLGVINHGILIFDPTTETFENAYDLYPSINRGDTLRLEDSDGDGIAEKWVTFTPKHWGARVEYKYVQGTAEDEAVFEGDVNQASYFGNRIVRLNNPQIVLPPIVFGEVNTFKAEDWPLVPAPDNLQSIRVLFSVDTRGSGTDEPPNIFIHGNTEPLRWFYKPSIPQTIHRAGNTMLVGTSAGGFHLFDLETGFVDQFWQQRDDDLVFPNNYVRSIATTPEGTFWMATMDGIINFSLDHGVIDQVRLDESTSNVATLARDASGNIWFTSRDGWVYRMDPNTRELTYSQKLTATSCEELMIDQSGMIWVGSAGSGVFRLDPTIRRFSSYNHIPATVTSTFGRSINAISEDQRGRIWMGGKIQGISILDRERGTLEYLAPPLTTRGYDPDYTVIAIEHVGSDYIWVATDTGIEIYDLAGERVGAHWYSAYESGRLSSRQVHDILEDTRGRIWVGGNWLSQYQPESDTFVNYEAESDTSQLSGQNIEARFLLELLDGEIWIGTSERGLIRFDPDTQLYEQFEVFRENPVSAEFIANDSRDQIWYIHGGNELAKFDPQDESVVHHDVDISASFPGRVQALEVDNQDRVWIATTQGLTRYDPTTGEAVHFYKADGLQDDEFGYRSSYSNPAGELFFGGEKGLNIFDPRNVEVSRFVPNVTLTRLVARSPNQSQSELIEDIRLIESVTLPYHTNDFTLEFAALDLRLSERNQYTYILEGFTPEWSAPQTNSKATYTNVPPGTYTFRVRGTNRDGVWSPIEANMTIMITPPWWRTLWAYGVYILIGFLVLWQIRRVEIRRIALENKILVEATRRREMQEVDRVKTNFFTNISHEFRTPLTLILGPLRELLAESSSERDQQRLSIMERNSQRLLGLINQLLELSRLDAQESKLNPNRGDLVVFLRGLLGAFQSRAEADDIDVQFTSEVDELVMGFDHERCEQIFTNILGNAFKFTPPGGSISLMVSKADDMVQVSIEDTGPGIPLEKQEQIFDRFQQVDDSLHRGQEGTGIGLSLAKQLVELHKGTLGVDSDGVKGSTFTVRLPMDIPAEAVTEEPVEHHEADPEFQAVLPAGEDESSTDRPTLLIIEDNADMRSYIRGIMQPDYNIEEAEDGVIGIEKALELLPDLIISDLMMPRKDGFQVSETLKNKAQTSHIPIVLLTAKAEHDSKLTGLETGADDYLVKPFDSRELRTRIHNLINQRERLRNQYRNNIHINPAEITVTSADAKFLEHVIELIEEDFQNEKLNVEWLSQRIGLSRRQFYHKIKTLTGDTPVEFILNLRLKRAALLLEGKAGTVSEIAYEVGFNNLSYFARAFKKAFGVAPSGYPQP